MTCVVREPGVAMYVYTRNEHPPPHVHVFIGRTVIRVTLLDLRILDPAPPRIRRVLLSIVTRHREEALRVWRELNEE